MSLGNLLTGVGKVLDPGGLVKKSSEKLDPLGITKKVNNSIDEKFGVKKGDSAKSESASTENPVDPQKIAEEEKKKIQKRVSKRTQTVYTSPLGVTDTANTERKQLLG